MEGGGKRRSRLRLLKWAVPLLRAKPTQIPDEHETGCQCVNCEAEQHLEASDWDYVRFYHLVKDQIVNLTPMGDANGQAWLVLRLEALESACRLYRIPEEDQVEMVETARNLFEAVQGRALDDMREAFSTPAHDLASVAAPGDR